MDGEVVGCLYYIEKGNNGSFVVSQTPFSGFEGFIDKVKKIRVDNDFVKWKPTLDKQIDNNF